LGLSTGIALPFDFIRNDNKDVISIRDDGEVDAGVAKFRVTVQKYAKTVLAATKLQNYDF